MNTYIFLAACIVLLLVFGVYVQKKVHTKPTAHSPQATTTVINLADISTTTKVGGYVIEPIRETPKGNTKPGLISPDFTKPMPYSASISPEVKAAIESQYTDLQVAITKNKEDFNAWIQLGVLHKIAGDYPGAADMWTYTSKEWPGADVSFNNLGDLYQNFLKNYPKAEANYKTALSMHPKNIAYYKSLFTLYHYQYKTNTSAASDIVAQGLKVNPNNPDLLLLQTQLQAGK